MEKGHSYDHNSLSYQRNVPFCIPKTARLTPEKNVSQEGKAAFRSANTYPLRITERYSQTSGFSFSIFNRHTSFIIFLLSWQFCFHPEKKQWRTTSATTVKLEVQKPQVANGHPDAGFWSLSVKFRNRRYDARQLPRQFPLS